MNNYEKIKSMNFEERELCKFLEKHYKKEVREENYKYFGDEKFVLLPTDLINETFGFSAYKLRIKLKKISEEIQFSTRLGQGRTKYFAFKGFKPTNFQRIKSMSIDEMAQWVCENFEITCDFCDFKCDGDCEKGFKQWLQKECE